VPVYRFDSGGRVRFAISHYRDGKRLRQFFTILEAAKMEALFVAQRIQSGMRHVTDLKPHERDSFKTAEAMLQKIGIPPRSLSASLLTFIAVALGLAA